MNTAIEECTLADEDYRKAARELFAFKIKEGFAPAALHLYRSADGSILYGRVRMHKTNADADKGREKLIRPFWHDGTRWTHGEPKQDGGKVLYGLRDVSACPESVVLLCEGEQKADQITKLGAGQFIGVTSGAASSAGAADWSPLAGRHVLAWPDNDAHGQRYCDEATAKLQALGCTVERIDVAALGLPEKSDVMDWTESFKTTHNRMPSADDVLALPRVQKAAGEPPEALRETGWPEPQPLTASIEPMEYPVESLPACIRAAVDEVCGFVQAPLPLVASSAIAALSLSIQAQVDVKRAEKLAGPVGLFMLTIAESGERKSTVDGFFTAAAKAYEREQVESMKPEMQEHRAKWAAWEAKRNGLLDKIRQDTKAGKPTAGIERDLVDHQAYEPEAPRVPALFHDDVTPEQLKFLLYKEWPSAGIVSSEAGIVFGSHGMGSESVTRNLATLNVLWDGGSVKTSRRTSETFVMQGARLTMALQVQAATIKTFFEKAGTLARGTGFMARFLIAWPESTQGTRLYREPPEHWPHLATFNQRLAEILRTPVPMSDDGMLEPQMLALSPEAKDAWIAFHDAIEVQLRDGGDLSDVRDVASKSADNAARMAALFHVFSGATGPIGLDSFGDAANIVAWHLSEAKRFFSELAVPDDVTDAAKLDAWLVEHCQTEHTQTVAKSHAMQFGPLRKADPLSAALKALEDLDRIRIEKIGKKTVIHVNPSLLIGGTQ